MCVGKAGKAERNSEGKVCSEYSIDQILYVTRGIMAVDP